jgi:CRP-like cAMP-binding protein
MQDPAWMAHLEAAKNKPEDEDNDNWLNALTKPSFDRTVEELVTTFRRLRQLKAFKSLSDFVLKELCTVMQYTTLDPGRVVFRQGDHGTSWYIIIRGRVNVNVERVSNPTGGGGGPAIMVSSSDGGDNPKPAASKGPSSKATTVTVLGPGDGFGELALVNDRPRAATIVTTAPCVLVHVEKGDYNRIVRYVVGKEIKEKCLFLRKIPIFNSWSMGSLKTIAGILTWKTLSKGEVLFDEGEKVGEIYFVREGELSATQGLRYENKTLRVPISVLKEGSYCGEFSVFRNRSHGVNFFAPVPTGASGESSGSGQQASDPGSARGPGPSSSSSSQAPTTGTAGSSSLANPGPVMELGATSVMHNEHFGISRIRVVAVSEKVVLGVVGAFDASSRFKNELAPTVCSEGLDGPALLKRHLELKEVAEWKRFKAKMVEQVFRESKGNPLLTVEKVWPRVQDCSFWHDAEKMVRARAQGAITIAAATGL